MINDSSKGLLEYAKSQHVDREWRSWKRLISWAALSMMALQAVVWLAYQFWRLFWQPTELAGRDIAPGAFDLLERYNEVTRWFRGFRVSHLVYPPASYLMLWPLMGWMGKDWTIRLWAITTVATLAWMTAIAVRESGVETRIGWTFVVLLPIAMYATGATIGNGQLGLQVMPLLMGGILLLRRRPVTLKRDLAGSLLVLASLVKPTMTAPFFWIVTLALRRLRPFVIVVLTYVALTLTASAFQTESTTELLRRWIAYGSESAFGSSALRPDTINDWANRLAVNTVQFVLTPVGMQRQSFTVGIVLFFLLGAWIYRHRDADSWLLIGVAALTARFWTYHRWYDDLLILLPMIAIIRIVRTEPIGKITAGKSLLGGAVVTSLAPGGLFILPLPFSGIYVIVQVAIWLAMLAYLVSWTAFHRQ